LLKGSLNLRRENNKDGFAVCDRIFASTKKRENMKEILIHYSGGMDSSYLVAKLQDQYDRIHLVTFLVPYDTLANQTLPQVKELQKICDHAELTHQFISVKDNVLKVRGGLSQCERDNKSCGFAYSWCLGCKLTMHASMIVLAKRMNIKEVADGSQSNDIHAREQHEDTLNFVRAMYAEYGIEYSNPIYRDYAPVDAPTFFRRIELVDDSKTARDYLKDKGFKLPSRFFGQHRTNQPFCPVALCLNIARLFRREKEDAVEKYFSKKEGLLRKLIEEDSLS
jgi:7-cyano-7-deazaguanine synthase in queuosine biosynthesis